MGNGEANAMGEGAAYAEATLILIRGAGFLGHRSLSGN